MICLLNILYPHLTSSLALVIHIKFRHAKMLRKEKKNGTSVASPVPLFLTQNRCADYMFQTPPYSKMFGYFESHKYQLFDIMNLLIDLTNKCLEALLFIFVFKRY